MRTNTVKVGRLLVSEEDAGYTIFHNKEYMFFTRKDMAALLKYLNEKEDRGDTVS
jgi:hypothetical protein